MSQIPMFPNKFAILASILGGMPAISQIDANTDVDAIRDQCVAGIVCGSNHNDDLPTGVYFGLFLCFKTIGNYLNSQIILEADNDHHIYMRFFRLVEQTWSEWATMA